MGSTSATTPRFDTLSPCDLQLIVDVGDDDVDIDADDDDIREEFQCPFCDDLYDVVALCWHIDDQHPLHAHDGVCPLCAKNVRMDFVGHITKEHGNFLKMQQHITRFRKGSPLNSMLRKELEEEALEALYGVRSSCIISSNCEPDPLLLPFIFNTVEADEPLSAQPSLFEATQEKESPQEDFLQRKPEQLQRLHLNKDQVEKDARRFEFVQELLMSTVIDDNL